MTSLGKKKSNKKGEQSSSHIHMNNNLPTTIDNHDMTTNLPGEETKTKKRKFDSIGESLKESTEGEAKLDEIIKEFATSPITEMNQKEMYTLLKKISTWIKSNSKNEEEVDRFIENVAKKLHEPSEEIKVVVHYEISKSKIEGIFSNFAKLLNRFVQYLVVSNITNYDDLNLADHKEAHSILELILPRVAAYQSTVHNFK